MADDGDDVGVALQPFQVGGLEGRDGAVRYKEKDNVDL